MNLCIFSGRITADPVVNTRSWKRQDGTEVTRDVCNFTLAVRESYDKDAQPMFVRVSAWGGLAKIVGDNAGKGREMTVTGPARVDSYIRKNGQPGVALGIRADSIELHGRKNTAEDAPADAPTEVVDPETGEVIPF